MRKVALLFIFAVLVPSLVLAWLAARSLRDQQFVLERQQSLLFQSTADMVAATTQDFLNEQVRSFSLEVERLLLRQKPLEFARVLDQTIVTNWPLADVGFAVTTDGMLLCPSSSDRAVAREFVSTQSRFLCNRETAEVYWMAAKQALGNSQTELQEAAGNSWNSELFNSSVGNTQKLLVSKSAQVRNVSPQQNSMQQPISAYDNFSRLNSEIYEFRQLIGDSSQGTLARFVDNRLAVLLWYRSPRETNIIFGAQLSLDRLKSELQELLDEIVPELNTEICVALLDDNARPVALTHRDFTANWKRPFVATEIGESLPHWEAAVYLLDPRRLDRAAFTLKLSLGLLIVMMLLAVGAGGWLIVNDLSRQLRLARQKTDFVSNVSHELKTPLTSIRMFSELLAEGRVADESKKLSYLHIITAETARLTRLINNVLDFSRLERGEKKYNFQECDLVKLARDAAESYRPHLENNGFTLECVFPESPLLVRGDPDALAQVLVNLLSNAEKYSNSRKWIRVVVRRHESPLPYAEVQVQDHGVGVPRGCEEKIFEKFYRAHDSLASGIQGSGLGLTLARQIARAHDGDVVYHAQEGEGSCFALRLPVKSNQTQTKGT